MRSQASFQHTGHHGVVFFDVNRYVVTEQNHGQLHAIRLPWAPVARLEVARFVTDSYYHMQAKERSCTMVLAISRPLTREQGDRLNSQRASVALSIGTALGALSSALTANAFIGAMTGAATRNGVFSKLPTYHAGDIIVAVSLEVSGGIGPQRSQRSIIIPSGKSG